GVLTIRGIDVKYSQTENFASAQTTIEKTLPVGTYELALELFNRDGASVYSSVLCKGQTAKDRTFTLKAGRNEVRLGICKIDVSSVNVDVSPSYVPSGGDTSGVYLSVATIFGDLGVPYGGCGVPQQNVESQHYVALNVQDTPGVYNEYLTRPITEKGKLGLFANGLNCGRWVEVTIGDECVGGNNAGTPGAGCEGKWVGDEYNGAKLAMVVTDSCHDGNRWCRDEKAHLDLHETSLPFFVKDGRETSGLTKTRWNNRQISWKFIKAPSYTGDIRIGFVKNAEAVWPAIVITNLENGIHAVEYWDAKDSLFKSAKMSGDNGQAYILGQSQNTNYKIRVIDAADEYINNKREYSFSFPEKCGSKCPEAYTQVTYTTNAP
ncbi:MAG: hypothetical protein HQK54_09595, partial [Oligoflexales bacterium]|nr:hypothetical protein [Oligoflexales bacterium]